MTNKTYLIVGGGSVASLAIGAAGGYLIAKKRFDTEIEQRIDLEVAKTKKHFRILLDEAQDKIAALEDVELMDDAVSAHPDEDEDDEADPEEELTEADLAAMEKGRESLAQASRALINYQGFAAKPPLDEVAKNIFADAATTTKKRKLPPRDPQGHFVKQTDEDSEKQVDDPYLITPEEFLLNDLDYEQENLKYFRRDKTLVQVYDNEEIDIARVGEVNLTLFPDVPNGEPSIVCVRNDGLKVDYEIQLTDQSLTEYMGFGESDADLEDDDEYASDG